MNKQPDTYDILEITNTDSPGPVRLFVSKRGYYQLRAENAALKAELKSIDGALDDPRANVTLTTAEIIWELKAELAEAKKDAERYREWKYRFREGECALFNALADCATDEEHDAAIDAAMKGK